MSQRDLTEAAPSGHAIGEHRIHRFIRIGWFVVGGLWLAFCLVVFVGGLITSSTESDSYVDGGAIASAAAMMALVVGGLVWLLVYCVIDIFSHPEG
jgi:hypothetical protein